MAIDKITASAFADDAITADKINLADTFAFTGTVSGASGSALDIDNYFHAQDQKASNTDGGTFTGGSFITRVFNTVLTNTISGASLSSNQITLPSGTYYVWGKAPARGTARTKTILYNATDSSNILIGTSDECHSSYGAQAQGTVVGKFILGAEKLIELRQQGTTKSGTGLGGGAGYGVVEVFAEIQIWKVA